MDILKIVMISLIFALFYGSEPKHISKKIFFGGIGILVAASLLGDLIGLKFQGVIWKYDVNLPYIKPQSFQKFDEFLHKRIAQPFFFDHVLLLEKVGLSFSNIFLINNKDVFLIRHYPLRLRDMKEFFQCDSSPSRSHSHISSS